MSIKVFDWIASHAENTPHKLAVTDLASARTYTYEQMHDRVGRLARYLQDSFQIKKGDRVGALCLNNSEILELQFACQRLGAICVLLNFRLALPELEYIVQDCNVSAFLTDAEFLDTTQKLAEHLGTSRILLTHADGSNSPYEQAIASSSPLSVYADLTLDDPSTIMYTSGTTGRPKGAIITHSMALFNAINATVTAEISAASVQYTFMPLFHTGGLNVFTLPVLHAGGSVLIAKAFDPGECLKVLSDPAIGVTHTLAVPAMMLFMMQHPDFETTDLTALKAFYVGGAPVPVSTLNVWLAAGVNVQQGYGMTETGPVSIGLNGADAARKVGSAGKPVMHLDVKVVDEQGKEVPPGQVGELWLKGPSITPGYWEKPEANASSFTDGWLHTGDAAMVDDEGYYYIVDRTKDMYISGGENVYPAEVEDVIYQMPGVIENAVIGIHSEKWGETGRAILVVKEGANITESAVIAHCIGQLAKFKVPQDVVFVDALPRNATGKVLKTELRKKFGN